MIDKDKRIKELEDEVERLKISLDLKTLKRYRIRAWILIKRNGKDEKMMVVDIPYSAFRKENAEMHLENLAGKNSFGRTIYTSVELEEFPPREEPTWQDELAKRIANAY
jgi:hypothetical protein